MWIDTDGFGAGDQNRERRSDKQRRNGGTRQVAASANAGNEPVFDDGKPADREEPGECAIVARGKSLEGLTFDSALRVWELLYWNIEAAGEVSAKYKRTKDGTRKAGKKGKNERRLEGDTLLTTEIKYPRMPQKMESLGPKRITLTFYEPRRGKWNYYQKVELFFHYKGTGNPGNQGVPAPDRRPNWFYYWSQEYPVTAAKGNPGFSFESGARSEWKWESNFTAAGTKSSITIAFPGSLSGFVGITGHEQQHEKDYWNVIWGGGGYVRAKDGDRDGLQDAWERTQPMAAGTPYGPWTFDVPAAPPLPAVTGTRAAWDNGRVHSAAFETEVGFVSWSDKQADVAAKNAVNANLGIDAKDWSDLIVRPQTETGERHTYADSDRPADKETADPTTSGNHKDHRP